MRWRKSWQHMNTCIIISGRHILAFHKYIYSHCQSRIHSMARQEDIYVMEWGHLHFRSAFPCLEYTPIARIQFHVMTTYPCQTDNPMTRGRSYYLNTILVDGDHMVSRRQFRFKRTFSLHEDTSIA